MEALWSGGALAVAVLAFAVFLSRGVPVSNAAPTIDPGVYDHYLRGLFHLKAGSLADIEKSVQHLEKATAAEPTFAQAYVSLAMAYESLGSTSTGGAAVADVIPRVVEISRKALHLDPRLATAHAVLARAHQQAGRWADAEEEYRRALDLDPDDAESCAGFGALLTWQGRTREGIAYARRARDLEPLMVERTVQLAWLLYHARQYDDAIRELRTVLAAEPAHTSALWFLGFALLDSSRVAEAIDTLEHLAVVWNRNPGALGLLARAYGYAGRRADALAIVRELKQRERAGYVPPAPFVHAYLGLGDRDSAFASLERAYRERSNIVQFVKTHPMYDTLRDDERFAALVHRVGLN